ncbi:MAG TPA: isoprenylcysteine carboxylmethyltransferase family protein [bacterium]|nr:isoprenylcysteine carboxylmethyltransferase family protein [bacterium]
MVLGRELERQGGWLFRWRTHLPLALLPILAIALAHSGGLEKLAGGLVDGIFRGLCVTISFAGLAFRCATAGFIPPAISTRCRDLSEAASLRTDGMYSLARHPLYFGNFLIMLGIAMFTEVWWFVVIVVLAFALYFERIMLAEEEELRRRFGDAYDKWAEKVPAFVPRFKGWQRPVTPFYFRSILKREYTGLLEILVAFAAIDFGGNWLAHRKVEINPAWLVAVAIGLVAYITLWTLKKTTRVLEGRD